MKLPLSYLILESEHEDFEKIKQQLNETDRITRAIDVNEFIHLLRNKSYSVIIAHYDPRRLENLGIFCLIDESEVFQPFILLMDTVDPYIERIIFEIGAYRLSSANFEILPVVVNRALIAARNYQKLSSSEKEQESMLAEIHHRVKNNLALIASMLQLQALHTKNSLLREKLDQGVNRIKTMADVHEQLYQGDSLAMVNVKKQLRQLVSRTIGSFQQTAKVDVHIHCEAISLTIKQAVSFFLIINELITLIVKYAFEGRNRGNVDVKVAEQKQQVSLHITNNGRKIHEMEDLESECIGMILVETLVKQLNGEYNFWSNIDDSHFEVKFQNENL